MTMGPGVPDDAFVRGDVPMSKLEVRAVTLAKARLARDSRVLDIGAGTGALAVDAALACPDGEVVAIERNPEALALVRENLARLGIANVRVVEGEAPEALLPVEGPFDAVLLGGTGGRLVEIVSVLPVLLRPGGRVVANTIGMESTAEVVRLLRAEPWRDWETASVSVARAEPIGRDLRFVPLNPVSVTSAVLGEAEPRRARPPQPARSMREEDVDTRPLPLHGKEIGVTDDMTYEAQLEQVVAGVRPTDEAFETAAWARLDRLTKPPRSLGRLEEIAARVARVQGTDRPSVERKAVLLMAGDHGVVAEGVSPFPQEVTWQMVANFANNGAAINQIAASVGAEVRVHDVGVAADVDLPGVVNRKVARGTRNMAAGPAMTREEAAQAVLVGIEAAREAALQGFTLLATGDMGIGNSTAAAALTAAYTGVDPAVVVGPGTGLDADGVARKAEVVRRALDLNRVASLDPLGVLAAVGGLEIAALAGVVIGAASEGVCVISDGFISGSATLAALAICPDARDYVLPSHLSAEPGHRIMHEHLGVRPVLELDMRLGEGTGAALAMSIVDAACRVLSGMATFAEAGVSEG